VRPYGLVPADSSQILLVPDTASYLKGLSRQLQVFVLLEGRSNILMWQTKQDVVTRKDYRLASRFRWHANLYIHPSPSEGGCAKVQVQHVRAVALPGTNGSQWTVDRNAGEIGDWCQNRCVLRRSLPCAAVEQDAWVNGA
jgi:hypothetical protein